MASAPPENNLPGPSSSKTEGDNSTLSPVLSVMTAMIEKEQVHLQELETKMKELLQNQVVVTEGLHRENERFKETEATFNMPALFQEVVMYKQKLSNLKGDMQNITDRTAKLKRRGLRLMQQQEQKALEQEQQRARLAEHEKHLIARPVWDPHDPPQ